MIWDSTEPLLDFRVLNVRHLNTNHVLFQSYIVSFEERLFSWGCTMICRVAIILKSNNDFRFLVMNIKIWNVNNFRPDLNSSMLYSALFILTAGVCLPFWWSDVLLYPSPRQKGQTYRRSPAFLLWLILPGLIPLLFHLLPCRLYCDFTRFLTVL